MPHPDDMTPVQEFRILIDERPEQAEAILAQGSESIAVLIATRRTLAALIADMGAHNMQMPLGKLAPEDTLATAAMKYGALLDRHLDLANSVLALERHLELHLEEISGLCPDCGSHHPMMFSDDDD